MAEKEGLRSSKRLKLEQVGEQEGCEGEEGEGEEEGELYQ